ncbi:MAG: hypothetical protein KY476_26810, partial [Planctomycetes bacterium]|nr:hypothetical protein [Planctomycetota bacterium]
MKARRLLALVLIWLQAAALALQTGTWVFPSCAAVAAAIGALRGRQVLLSPRQAFYLAAGLAATFIVKYLIAPHELPWEKMFIRTQLALAVGQALIVVEVLQFFVGWQRAGWASPDGVLVPGLGVVAMICFAAVRV